MRKKRILRILSVLMVLVMIFSAVPMMALAEDEDDDGTVNIDDMTEEEQRAYLKELEAQIQTYRDNANEQAKYAKALQEEIQILDKQISQVEKEIVDLNAQINAAKLKLDTA